MKKIKINSYRACKLFFIIDKILLYKNTKIGVLLDDLFKFICNIIYQPIKNKKVSKIVESYDLNNIPIFKWIEIETFNRCNEKCSFCPVNINEPQRPIALMHETLFKKIIDELVELKFTGNLNLYSNNEPFLDSRIFSFAKYTFEKLPLARKKIMTNGSVLTIEKCERILPYIDELFIDNYNDNLVMNPTTKQIYDYFKHNKYGEKIIICIRKKNELLSSRGGFAPNKKIAKTKAKCVLPFRQLVIRPTGKVSLCCNDPLGKSTLGDITKNSLKEIWYSQTYKDIRNNMMKDGRFAMKSCINCDFTTLTI